ncbi:MAG TPA: hypothetical protein VGH54_28150 [Mycobacterium sp.]|uniref:hypothetical protein n=1 Tax=Mycobacterium sp. TaxID=1785 RepID=UPI002F42701E
MPATDDAIRPTRVFRPGARRPGQGHSRPRPAPQRAAYRPSARQPARGQPRVAPRGNPAQTGGQPPVAPKQDGGGGGGGQDQEQSRDRSGLSLPGGSYHRIVIAEFLATVVIISAAPFLVPREANSAAPEKEAAAAVASLKLSRPLVRLTAACVVFFLLALMANGARSGRTAAALGGLVTLGALLNATDTWAALGQMFTGAAHLTAGADQGIGTEVADKSAGTGGAETV